MSSPLKDVLLPPERCPFASQKMSFRHMKDDLLKPQRYAFPIKNIFILCLLEDYSYLCSQ